MARRSPSWTGGRRIPKGNKSYGAASYNFQTQVGDDHTQPDRVSYFKARLERSHLRENGKLMVALNRFDIWLDRTGTSPSGFFMAGKIAVTTYSHANDGNNKLSCTINSQVDEDYISANTDVLYQPDESAAAMQRCLDDVIDKWIEVARTKFAK